MVVVKPAMVTTGNRMVDRWITRWVGGGMVG